MFSMAQKMVRLKIELRHYGRFKNNTHIVGKTTDISSDASGNLLFKKKLYCIQLLVSFDIKCENRTISSRLMQFYFQCFPAPLESAQNLTNPCFSP